jgi:hypothetical protein
MSAFANQVHNCPMSLPDLQILNSKRGQFRPAQSAADEHGDHREIAEAPQIVTICFCQ